MTKKITAWLSGMGSVLDVAPAPREDLFMPRGSDVTRLRADFERIGEDLRQVFTDRIEDGQDPNRQQT